MAHQEESGVVFKLLWHGLPDATARKELPSVHSN